MRNVYGLPRRRFKHLCRDSIDRMVNLGTRTVKSLSCLSSIHKQSVPFRFQNFSVSKLFQFFGWYRIRYRKSLVSEKNWYRKKYRIQYRKKLVSKKYRIWYRKLFGIEKLRKLFLARQLRGRLARVDHELHGEHTSMSQLNALLSCQGLHS